MANIMRASQNADANEYERFLNSLEPTIDEPKVEQISNEKLPGFNYVEG